MDEYIAFPFVSFTVAISEGKSSAIIVENIGVIDEIRLRRDNLHRSIVDGPGIIIHENPDVRRPDNFEIAPFAKCRIRIIRGMRVTAV